MTLLILVILGSLYYAFFKNNEVEVTIEKSKYFVQQRFRNIDLDKIPLNLQKDVENMLQEPNTLELKKIWTSELPFDLSMQPFFDLDNLYLVALDKIVVYDKRNSNIIWKKQLKNKIILFDFLDRNRIVVCDDSSNFYNINRKTGVSVWVNTFHELKLPLLNQNLSPKFISRIEDQRLNQSIFIIPKKNSLVVVNVETGKEISSISLDSEILYMSDYDKFDNCFYIVCESKLIKLKLENSKFKPILK